MVCEPVEVLRRFVEHNLTMGASYVHLFFDNPDDPAYDEFANQPGVITQRCDVAYWARMDRRRPPYVERRQLLNGRVAYERCLTDWQAHFDADELVLTQGTTLGELLARVPGSFQTAHLGTVEPMLTGETSNGQVPFRRSVRHLKYRARLHVYGDDLHVFRNGLFGHYQGKSILRAGLSGWSHGIHFPRPSAPEVHNAIFELNDAHIAHMHCESRDLWVKRTMGKMRDTGYNLRTGSYDLLPLVAPETTGPEKPAEEDLVAILSGFYDRVSLLSDSLRARMEAFDLLQYHEVERLG
ncbi:glycosyltransferase family 2 protein [Ruegeria aquimaris]|uniref:Glycosyltransferase family 2 protein n=1 Tax=Ruegeria aquimaris TaxID=2984333 RepID=A0ABT3ARR8_9RHOB|nr:glycosyltransferase family 2 protein [Ruegeria sp. XHP0148]MCV2891383.1 glycosyltransferase family 2 protein [Ruegeria sp. XHP0148]